MSSSPRPPKRPLRAATLIIVALLSALIPAPLSAAPEPGIPVFVNSTGDGDDRNDGDGPCDTGRTNSTGQAECTLRAAIETTNRGGANHIFFDIPTSDPGYNGSRWRISVQSSLPSVVGDTEIEGDTQPQFNGTPIIEVHNAGSAFHGIRFANTNDASVEYLSIINFRGPGIDLSNGDNTTVANNYIGVTATGGNGGNDQDGVSVLSGSGGAILRNNVIGFNEESGIDIAGGSVAAAIDGNFIGVTPSGANVGNDLNGIHLSGGAEDATIGATTGNVIGNNGRNGILVTGPKRIEILNNTIGLTPNRQQQASNADHGVYLQSGATATIGSVANPNVIGSNGRNGVRAEGSSADVIGNFIGTNPARSRSFGNGFPGGYSGVSINNAAQRSTVTDNVIANNSGRGVAVRSNAVQVSRNLISGNVALAIDLNGDGVTPNDPGDRDGGQNNFLNYPVVSSINTSGGQAAVTFALDVPSGSYTIELFENVSPDPSGFGEAERLIRSFAVTSSGSATTRTFTGVNATPGRFLSATITDNNRGITSELGPNFLVPAAPTTTVPPTTTTTVPPTTTTTVPPTTNTTAPTTTAPTAPVANNTTTTTVAPTTNPPRTTRPRPTAPAPNTGPGGTGLGPGPTAPALTTTTTTTTAPAATTVAPDGPGGTGLGLGPTAPAPAPLSLIHISEPTRPY